MNFQKSTRSQFSYNSEKQIVPRSSGFVDSDYVTAYDIHYQQIDYQQIASYSGVNLYTNDIIGYTKIIDSSESLRILVFKNGSIVVFNTTTENYSLYNFTKKFIFQLDVSDFLINQLLPRESTITDKIYLAGTNKTDYSLIFKELTIDLVNDKFDETVNYSVPIPTNFSLSASKIYTFEKQLTWYYIGGRYVNVTSSIPFLYRFTSSGGFLDDIFDLNTTSTNYHSDFNNSIMKFFKRTEPFGPVYELCSESFYFEYNPTIHSITRNYSIGSIIPITNSFISFSNKSQIQYDSTIIETFSYSYFDYLTASLERYIINMNSSWHELIFSESPVVAQAIFDESNYFGAFPDFEDGIVAIGSDHNDLIFNEWTFSTGSKGITQFDVYVPIQFIKVTSDIIELSFSDSRGFWIATFTNNDTGLLNIGQSNISAITSLDVSISHRRGTNDFTYEIAGFIERNSTSSEIVQVGIIPYYLSTFLDDNNQMLSISNILKFDDSTINGVLTRPKSIFSTYGNKYLDFFVEFEADYCPFVDEVVGGLDVVDLWVGYLIYELYSDGNYTQKLIVDNLKSKSSFYLYSYELETSIVLEDSHLVDELHVFSGGVEYDPYFVMFTNSSTNLLITDKFTNDTLYEENNVIFRDPLFLSIPSKYEGWLKIYSNVDGFGLDFSWFNVTINNTEISTNYFRILSPNAEINIKDFSESIIKNVTINKIQNGSFISIGVDMVQVSITNKYNFSTKINLIKNEKTISFTIGPQFTWNDLRLAFGEYRYIVTDIDGNELIDDIVVIGLTEDNEISFGFTKISADTYYQTSIIDYITMALVFSTIIGLVLFLAIRFRRTTKSSNKSPKKRSRSTRSTKPIKSQSISRKNESGIESGFSLESSSSESGIGSRR